MKRYITIAVASLSALLLWTGCTSRPAIEPYGPVPSGDQLAWQRMEINMFCHFGPNTFSGAEWGSGLEAESLFNPEALDCRQWVSTAQAAGMSGIIITAKHHDGFCLWPSAQSRHTVAQSPWREGQGDVLGELRTACSEAGLPMGVYLSPWDRNDPTYGSKEYNSHFASSLREVHEAYGPLFEQWFDGACGEGPAGKRQEYDWDLFFSTIRSLNPHCIMFSDIGPGCRWVGNEAGTAGETCYSLLTLDSTCKPGSGSPSPKVLESGLQDGEVWIPAECDVSLRAGWFYHEGEEPKTVSELMDIYFNSVGHNALLLLNVPPNKRGVIAPEDSVRLMEFRAERDRIFAHDLAQRATASSDNCLGRHYAARHLTDTAYHTYFAAKHDTVQLTLQWASPVEFDIIMLQEYIPLGQRVNAFSISYEDEVGDWHPAESGEDQTTIGYKRLLRLPQPISTRRIRVVLHAAAPPVLNRIALFNSHQQ